MNDPIKYLEDLDILDIEVTAKPLNNSVSGYGGKIPTEYLLHIGKRSYRVYAICWSNAASFYVTINNERLFLALKSLHKLEDFRNEYNKAKIAANPARQALTNAVNKAIANGAPVYVNEPTVKHDPFCVCAECKAGLRISVGNQPTCEDCGQPIDICECE